MENQPSRFAIDWQTYGNSIGNGSIICCQPRPLGGTLGRNNNLNKSRRSVQPKKQRAQLSRKLVGTASKDKNAVDLDNTKDSMKDDLRLN